MPRGTRGLYGIMKKSDKGQSIYSILNRINTELVDTKLSPGDFIKKSFNIRTTRNKKLSDVMSSILKADFNIHLLNQITDKWERILEFKDLLNETETESKMLLIKYY